VNWLIYETAKWRNVGQDIRRSEHQGIREPVYQGTLETRRRKTRRQGDWETGEKKEVLKLRSWEDGKRGEKFQMINYKYQITNAK